MPTESPTREEQRIKTDVPNIKDQMREIETEKPGRLASDIDESLNTSESTETANTTVDSTTPGTMAEGQEHYQEPEEGVGEGGKREREIEDRSEIAEGSENRTTDAYDSNRILQFFDSLVCKNTHALLGRTGIRVSRICLGTMNFMQKVPEHEHWQQQSLQKEQKRPELLQQPEQLQSTEQLQPTEQKPTEQLHTEQQPTEQQHTEQQPTEQQPTEQQPIEQQPIEQQSTEQMQEEQAPEQVEQQYQSTTEQKLQQEQPSQPEQKMTEQLKQPFQSGQQETEEKSSERSDTNFLSEQEAHRILDRFVELGGNCIDTADYFNWSESVIGSWLHRKGGRQVRRLREQLFLISKVRMPNPERAMYGGVNYSGGLSRNYIIESLERTLHRLNTTYVDLLQLNDWDETVNVQELVRTMDELIRLGKVRYFGVCDLKGWQLQKIIDTSLFLNMHPCVCYEGEYNLLTRGCELEVADVCQSERIGFFAYSPFKYGYLNNDYNQLKQSKTPEPALAYKGNRFYQNQQQFMTEQMNELVSSSLYSRLIKSCERIAQKRNLTISQIAMLWVLQKNFVTSVVLGVDNLEQLEENMSILNSDVNLTFEEIQELNEASQFKRAATLYPYSATISAGYKILRSSMPNLSLEQLAFIASSLKFGELQLQRQQPHQQFQPQHRFYSKQQRRKLAPQVDTRQEETRDQPMINEYEKQEPLSYKHQIDEKEVQKIPKCDSTQKMTQKVEDERTKQKKMEKI